MSSSIIKTLFKSPAPLPVKIIAWYFFLHALVNTIDMLGFYNLTSGYSLLSSQNYPEFLGSTLPGILSNDPISHGIITAIPLYDMVSIYLKDIATVIVALLVGYYLLKLSKTGLWLGTGITVLGLIFTMIDWKNPLDYITNIIGGIQNHGILSDWTVMGIMFLMTVFIPIYLLKNRKLFKTK